MAQFFPDCVIRVRFFCLTISKFFHVYYLSNHMIFLVQFGINKHLHIFQRPQIAIARAILLVLEKFTRAYLF